MSASLSPALQRVPRQRPATLMSLIPEQAARCTGGLAYYLPAASQDRPGPAVTCIVVAALRDPGQRALIDEDGTGDRLGQRRVAASQQRLPVKPDGVPAIGVGVPATCRAGCHQGTNRAGLTRSQHRKAPS